MDEAEIAKIKEEINESQNKIKEYEKKKKSYENANKQLTSKIEIANENIKHFEEKEKYQLIQTNSNSAKVCLSNAQSNISDAYLSYNNNFQGNSATVKLSTFTNSNSKIRKIREKLAKIYEEATAKLKKLNQKISSNNASIGVLTYNIADCNKAINKFKKQKTDNSKKITYYNTKRRKEQDNIARLRRKLY